MNSGYLGGFFDGEGTVYETSGKVRISIPQTEFEVLNKIKDFVGYGQIYETKKKKDIHKQAWVYNITSREGVYRFLKLVENEVYVKKNEVIKFISVLEQKESKSIEDSLIRKNDIEKVTELKSKGNSYREISKIMGFSRQKVFRLLKENVK
jgi:hypothetical protein